MKKDKNKTPAQAPKTSARTLKGKSFWLKLTALVLAVVITAGTGVFFLVRRRPVMKIASRSEIIKLWDDQGITQHFADELGVKIKWIDYGTEDVYNRVSADLGKEPGELPDVYLGLGLQADQLRTLVAQDAFLNFENMVETYAPNLRERMNSDVARLPEMRTEGKLISFPSFNEQYGEEYPQKAWINQAWLRKAGITELPGTPQQLLKALRKFKTLDLNGNGVQDEVPLAAAYRSPGNMTTFGFLVHAFVTTDYDLSETNYLNVQDGTVYAGVTQKGYKSALEYLHTLFSEGLVDSDVFSQGAEVFLGNGIGEEKYGVILAKDLNALFNDPGRAAAYVPLPPLQNGRQNAAYARRTTIKTGGFLIPNRVEPEQQLRALALGDAMLGRDGTLTVCYGLEDTGWFRSDAGALAMGGLSATWKQADNGFDGTAYYSGFLGEVPYWNNAQLQMERQAPEGGTLQTAKNWQGYLNKVTNEAYEPVGRGNIANALPELVPDQETVRTLDLTGLMRYLTSASQDFVTGKADIAAGWNGFVQTLNEKGLQKIIDAMQDAYNRSAA
jgi:putative aldouronate transport system substrate-binding protein